MPKEIKILKMTFSAQKMKKQSPIKESKNAIKIKTQTTLTTPDFPSFEKWEMRLCVYRIKIAPSINTGKVAQTTIKNPFWI